MNNLMIWQIFLQFILIALNAVFACAEIAVISMHDSKLNRLVAQGDKRAMRLAHLTSQPARFLATIQVAITLSGFLGSAFAADNFSDKLVQWLVSVGVTIPVATLDTISVVFITLILSYFTLVFGELVPKRIAMKKAEQLALGMSALISCIAKLFAPVVFILTASTNCILRLCGIDPNAEEDEVSEEEIRMMVDVGSQKGVIDLEENQIIQNVFEFDDLRVGEFATHRTDIALLWADDTDEEWEKTIHESRHSLYPVCGGAIDNVIGILNVKDYFRLKDKARERVMAAAVKPPYFVPESIYADVLFRQMKKSHNHFAVVLDEYGGMTGIVTMNDLLEQLVGDLENDTSRQKQAGNIECVDAQTWTVQGNAELDKVAEKLGVSLPTQKYDTFGGFVFGAYGVIPNDGSVFEVDTGSLHIRVTGIREHRIESAIVNVNASKCST